MARQLLPARRSSTALARVREPRLQLHGALVDAAEPVRYRHAFEVRQSYFCDEFYELLSAHDCALVIADTAGKFAYSEAITTDFAYVRLHGSTAIYASDYDDAELENWSSRIRCWMRRGNGRVAYVYFDNDARVHAPHNAMQLAGLMGRD